MLDTLKMFCDEVGRDVLLVQGPGANISAKNEKSMLIKASGCILRTMIEKKGFVELDPTPLAKAYKQEEFTEEQARDLTKKSIIGEFKRPSMEAGFHSYLGKYIIHTHPIYLNAILCSKDANERVKKIFPDSLFIPYARPGHELSVAIAKEYDGQEVILLQNHGLIISTPTADECVALTKLITLKAEHYVIEEAQTWIDHYKEPMAYTHEGVEGFLSNYDIPEKTFLFPDAAVFLFDMTNTKEVDGKVFYPLTKEAARDIDEVLYAHYALAHLTEKLSTRNPLTQEQVSALVNMEEEKARKALVR